ncbi:hypothetical protein [Carnobacterium sp.]|uniref:hypothetical protein n=1 Tax=Carnobacterium sp. TaxID=48221 RepID=UPI003C74D68B
MNQKGAILPSVVIFVFLMSTIMIGTARIYKNQMQQMKISKNYYLIQTMIALSKTEVQRQLAESKDYEKSVFIFEDGKVKVSKVKVNSYEFIGETKNSVLEPLKVMVTFPSNKESIDKKERTERKLVDNEKRGDGKNSN